ncbi:MAG: hypothetical protein J6C42_11475, partial [Clostridia bacterium]|nr:hypothetical protein [Clostridia bacterium]
NSQWDAFQPSNKSEISITAEELDIARKKAETEVVEEPAPVSKTEKKIPLQRKNLHSLNPCSRLKRFGKGFGGTFSSKRFPQEKISPGQLISSICET